MSGTLVLFTAKVAEQRAEEQKESHTRVCSPEAEHLSMTPSTDNFSQYATPETIDEVTVWRKSLMSRDHNAEMAYPPIPNNSIMTTDKQMEYHCIHQIGLQQDCSASMPSYTLTPPFAATGIIDSPMSMMGNQIGGYMYGDQEMSADLQNSYVGWDLGTQYQNDMVQFEYAIDPYLICYSLLDEADIFIEVGTSYTSSILLQAYNFSRSQTQGFVTTRQDKCVVFAIFRY